MLPCRGNLLRAQGYLHQIQDEVRGLRPLRDELGFARRRAEELRRRLVEQRVARLGRQGAHSGVATGLALATDHPSPRKSRSWPACWSDRLRHLRNLAGFFRNLGQLAATGGQ